MVSDKKDQESQRATYKAMICQEEQPKPQFNCPNFNTRT